MQILLAVQKSLLHQTHLHYWYRYRILREEEKKGKNLVIQSVDIENLNAGANIQITATLI